MNTTERSSIVPVPDPSVLTTAQLDKAILGVREILETRINCMEELTTTMSATIGKVQSDIDAAIDHLKTLFEVKFDGVEKQFVERDKRTEQLSLADKTAIAAALQAQKEAAGAQNESNATANAKTETNFAKLIEQGQGLLLEVRRNTEVQINDLKSRIDKGEGHSKGTGDSWGYLVGFLGMVAAVMIAIVEVMRH